VTNIEDNQKMDLRIHRLEREKRSWRSVTEDSLRLVHPENAFNKRDTKTNQEARDLGLAGHEDKGVLRKD